MQQTITFIAQYFLILSFVGAGGVWFTLGHHERKQFLVIAIVGAILTLALAKLSGMFYYDARPFVVGHFIPYFAHANDNGFPSDHTLLSSFLGFLVLRFSKLWGSVLLFLALLIGLSRVAAGVHHVVDIAGSFVIAGLSVLVVSLLVHKFYAKPEPLSIKNSVK